MQSGVAASALLEPVSADAPCGRDLDSSLELYALENAARAPDEPSIGGQEAVDSRNWRDVARKSEALLKVSKDLRIAVYLTRALTNIDGLPGFAAGISIMRGLVERYWDGLFPALDPEDQDPQMRITALNELWTGEVVTQLRGMATVKHREFGTFTLNDVLASRNAPEARKGANTASPAHVVKALELMERPAMASLHAIACAVVDDLMAIQNDVTIKVNGTHSVNPAALIGAREDRNGTRAHSGLLGRLVQILEPYVASAHPDQPGGESTSSTESADLPQLDGVDGSVTARGSQPMRPGEIRSREDVIRMLDLICSYYERYEPSSPVPLLMQRARGMVTMSFLDIVKSLANKGLSQVELVAGLENGNRDDD